jgi:hypothetical protein
MSNTPLFFSEPLYRNTRVHMLAYTTMFFLNTILITIIIQYINYDCCKENVSLIRGLLIATALFITSIISRLFCVNCGKINREQELIQLDTTSKKEDEYFEI